MDLLHCPVRRSILLNLATAGKANITALTARMNSTSLSQATIPANTLSQDLARLRTAGLGFSEQRGKERWYETAEDRVRFERQGDGRFSLTINARGGGVAVTISISGEQNPAHSHSVE